MFIRFMAPFSSCYIFLKWTGITNVILINVHGTDTIKSVS